MKDETGFPGTFGFPSDIKPEIFINKIKDMIFPGHDKENPVRLMEVCGTHTMAIAECGLKKVLPESVRMISGPGCPVCVTPPDALDEIIRIAKLPDVIITSYGDLLRVPGSVRGCSLAASRSEGCDIRTVYSPMDALDLACDNPDKNIIFIGVGFETTAPGTAVLIKEAALKGLKNFSVLSLLKLTPPAVRAILDDPECRVDGLLCPGHVAVITGSEAFRFLPDEYKIPAVVSGFETEDIAASVYELCRQISCGSSSLCNEYSRAVSRHGNKTALSVIDEVFTTCASEWRGLGNIPNSGLMINNEFADYDAAKRFVYEPAANKNTSACRCGDVLRGLISPNECAMFGTACTPSDPVGPCMVSGEGSCAAAYKYGD